METKKHSRVIAILLVVMMVLSQITFTAVADAGLSSTITSMAITKKDSFDSSRFFGKDEKVSTAKNYAVFIQNVSEPVKAEVEVTTKTITVTNTMANQEYICSPDIPDGQQPVWNDIRTVANNGDEIVFENLQPNTNYLIYTRIKSQGEVTNLEEELTVATTKSAGTISLGDDNKTIMLTGGEGYYAFADPVAVELAFNNGSNPIAPEAWKYAEGNVIELGKVSDSTREYIVFNLMTNGADKDEFIGSGDYQFTPVTSFGSGINGDDQTGNFTIKLPSPTIDVTLDNATVAVGETTKAKASTTNAAGATARWISLNEAVATVDANGTVTAVGVGSTQITGTIQVGNMSYSDSVTVVVEKPRPTVNLSLDKESVVAGETAIATVKIGNPGNGTVVWSSSDVEVAEVTEVTSATAEGTVPVDGTTQSEIVSTTENVGIKAKKAGEAVITASITVDGVEYSDTVTLTVSKAPTISVTLDKESLNVAEFTTVKAKITNAPDGTGVTWSSSNTAVATVDADGTVTAVGAGSAEITASITVDGVEYSDTVTLTVNPVPTISVTLDKESVLVGETATAKAKITNAPDDTVVTWSSSNTAAAGVLTDGTVIAVGAGEAEITATITVDGVEYSDSARLTVKPTTTIELTPTPTISVTLDKASITQGEKMVVIALTTNAPVGTVVTWSSSNTAVAEVDADGKVEAVAAGETLITATITVDGKEYSDTVTLTVTEKPVPTIEVNLDKATVVVGQSAKATATITNAPDDTVVTWSSSNTDVAKVYEFGRVKTLGGGKTDIIATVYAVGKVTTVGAEIAVIKATITVDGKEYSDTVTLTVTEKPVPTIDVTLNKATVVVGETAKATATITNAPDSTSIYWSSYNTAVARVDGFGTVETVGAGKTEITATLTVDGVEYSGSATLTVTASEGTKIPIESGGSEKIEADMVAEKPVDFEAKTEAELLKALVIGATNLKIDGRIALTQPLKIATPIKIVGLSGAALDGQGKVALLEGTGANKVAIEGVTLQNASGGIFKSTDPNSVLEITNCTLFNNTNDNAPLLVCGTINVSNSIVKGNQMGVIIDSDVLPASGDTIFLDARKIFIDENTKFINNKVNGKFVSDISELFTSADPDQTYPQISIVTLGDANVDGAIDINDVVDTLKYIIKIPTSATFNEINADANLVQGVELEDVVETLKYIVNLPSVIIA